MDHGSSVGETSHHVRSSLAAVAAAAEEEEAPPPMVQVGPVVLGQAGARGHVGRVLHDRLRRRVADGRVVLRAGPDHAAHGGAAQQRLVGPAVGRAFNRGVDRVVDAQVAVPVEERLDREAEASGSMTRVPSIPLRRDLHRVRDLAQGFPVWLLYSASSRPGVPGFVKQPDCSP